jgi:hypothetical protein
MATVCSSCQHARYRVAVEAMAMTVMATACGRVCLPSYVCSPRCQKHSVPLGFNPPAVQCKGQECSAVHRPRTPVAAASTPACGTSRVKMRPAVDWQATHCCCTAGLAGLGSLVGIPVARCRAYLRNCRAWAMALKMSPTARSG